MAQSIFPAIPIRIAKPDNIEGLFDELKDPAFSTVTGLLLYKAGKHTEYEIDFKQELLHTKIVREKSLNDIKIDQTINEVAESKFVISTKEPKQNSHKQDILGDDSESFSFNDLPNLKEENNNPFKKLANWARDLF